MSHSEQVVHSGHDAEPNSPRDERRERVESIDSCRVHQATERESQTWREEVFRFLPAHLTQFRLSQLFRCWGRHYC